MLATIPATTRTLRDYQQKCIDHTLIVLESERACWYQLPTGTGKTRVAAGIIERLPGAPNACILFVAHRKKLVQQTATSFQQDLPDFRTGICMGVQNEISDKDILVATCQTLVRDRLDKILERYDHVDLFLDEAHHVSSENYYATLIQTVLAHNPANKVIACTATPFRSDMKGGLNEVVPCCSFSRSIEEMQTAGWLAPIAWYPVHVTANIETARISSIDGEPDYKQEDLERILFPTMLQIVKRSVPLLEQRKTVVFCPSIEFAKRLSATYNEELAGTSLMSSMADPPAAAIWSGMKQAELNWILDRWQHGGIQIVVNVGILTEGFDFPNIAAVVNATPTRSPGRYLQMLGRGTRLKSGKYQDCRVIDVVGNANLIETKQIVLPKVRESVSLKEEEILENPALLDSLSNLDDSDDDEDEATKTSQPKEKGYKILDPLSKSVVAWGRLPDYYYASLGNGQVAIAKKQAESGLWQGWILLPQGYDPEGRQLWKRQQVAKPTTLNFLVQHLNHIILANGILKLVQKEANWRKNPASERALRYLSKLDKAEGAAASENRWNAGFVGLRITFHQTKHLIGRL